MITWQHSNVKAWEREGDRERRSPPANNSFSKKILWTWIFFKHRDQRWTWRIHLELQPRFSVRGHFSPIWKECVRICMPESKHANHFLPRTLQVLLSYPCRCAVGLADSICLFYLWVGKKKSMYLWAQQLNNFLFGSFILIIIKFLCVFWNQRIWVTGDSRWHLISSLTCNPWLPISQSL